MPELGTIKAKHIPLVVLTSNNAREMSDALKRRCLHLYIDFPRQRAGARDHPAEGARRRRARSPTRSSSAVQAIRKLDLKKTPSISETLDWARALTLLNVDTLDDELVDDTLSTILKYEGDIRKAQQELKEHVAQGARQGRRRRRPPPRRRTSCTERREGSGAVDDKILSFVGLLRQNGVRVSFAESMDTFRALDLVGLGSRAA